MKKISLLLLLSLIVGCSSTRYISTNEYSAELKSNCIEGLSVNDKKNQKALTDCSFKAANQIQVARRFYQLRAEDDNQKCAETTSDVESKNACFEKKQVEYYENIVNQTKPK